ncbi:MAG TPA: ribosome maturation factor RimM [Acidimicrobiales bacterium]|nr:ribosome maturation factor RimM [Acidimicrobiales bacterium]
MLTVGRIARAHGLRGEVVVDLWTDQVQRLSVGSELSSAVGPLRVVSARETGQGRFLVQFEGVFDRTGAERLRGVELSAEPVEVPGALWVHELVGSSVRDASSGAALGVVQAIEANPASDLLVLESGALIPLRFVTAHDGAARTVDVEVPEGLLDL